jgi:hypothetical protein
MRNLFVLLSAVVALAGNASAESITGEYLEARNSEVWIGECFANSEMNIVGNRAILGWKVKAGVYDDVALDGLKVVAVVFGDKTFGIHKDVKTQAVFLVDDRADETQRHALVAMARALAGPTIQRVVAVRSAKITLETGLCETAHRGCAELDAGIAKIKTRCLKDHDSICGHEEIAYPVLSQVRDEYAAYTITSEYTGRELNANFRNNNSRSAVIGRFSL